MENRFTAGADDIPRSEAGDEIAWPLRNSETCISIARDMRVSPNSHGGSPVSHI